MNNNYLENEAKNFKVLNEIHLNTLIKMLLRKFEEKELGDES
jgi:hypothetical protein